MCTHFADDHGHILTTTEESRKVVDENQPQKATKNSVNEAEIVAVIEAITKDTQVYNDILLYKVRGKKVSINCETVVYHKIKRTQQSLSIIK